MRLLFAISNMERFVPAPRHSAGSMRAIRMSAMKFVSQYLSSRTSLLK